MNPISHNSKLSACLETPCPTHTLHSLRAHCHSYPSLSLFSLPPVLPFEAANLLHHKQTPGTPSSSLTSSSCNSMCCTAMARTAVGLGLGAAVSGHHHPVPTTHGTGVAQWNTLSEWSFCNSLSLTAASFQEASPVAQPLAVPGTCSPCSGRFMRP